MPEATLISSAPVSGINPSRAVPDTRSAPQRKELIEKLEKLAAEATTKQQQNLRDLEKEGFRKEGRHFTERDGRVARIDRLVAGDVAVQTSIEFPDDLIDAIDGAQNAPVLGSFAKEYLAAKTHPIFGARRFACGRLWYTVKEAWTAKRLSDACRHFGIPDNARHEELERQLHFHFQRLYRKPSDDWTDAEASEWDVLAAYIDVEAYTNDNPPTENRIGQLVRIDAERIVIRWNTKGEIAHDSRSVPPELLTAQIGWIVHAEFYVGNGSEVWLFARIAPPLDSDEKVIADDVAAAAAAPPTEFAVADWPKVKA